MLITVAISLVLLSMVLLVFRGVSGPTIFDRILAANSFGTNIVILIVLIGVVFKTEFYVDIALTYALINFITTIALLRYFESREG